MACLLGRRVLVSTLVALLLCHVRGQIYSLDAVQAPINRSLEIAYQFYIYSWKDAPAGIEGGSDAYLKFHEVHAHSTEASQPDAKMAGYEAMQVGIMRQREFENTIDETDFCCTQENIDKKICNQVDQLMLKKKPGVSYADAGVFIHTIQFQSGKSYAKDLKINIPETGMYALLLVNCGDFDKATLGGTISVKNPYGFLPGNEYHKMTFYGWLSQGYALLAILWMVGSARYWKDLIAMHYCISGAILLAGLDAFMWYIFFSDWNNSGARSDVIFFFSLFVSCAKSAFCYLLVLVASLGWGVTKPYLDSSTKYHIQVLFLASVNASGMSQLVVSYALSHSLPWSLVFLSALPVQFVNGYIFYEVVTSISVLIALLKDRNQQDKLHVIQRLQQLVFLTVVAAFVTMVYQMYRSLTNHSIRWTDEWIFSDALSHSLNWLFLIGIMYLWMPHSGSQAYGCSQGDGGGKGKDSTGTVVSQAVADAFWADEEAGDGEEKEALKKPQPTTVGTSAPAPGSSSTSILSEAIRQMDELTQEEDKPVQKSTAE